MARPYGAYRRRSAVRAAARRPYKAGIKRPTRLLRAAVRRWRLRRRRRLPRINYGKIVKHKAVTRLTYCDTKTLTPGAGAAAHTFRLNNLFDVDYSGGGHQPAYRDQWQALYGKYQITGASWTITYHFSRGTLVNSAIIGIGTNATEAGVYSDSTSNDQRYCKALVFTEVNNKTTRLHTNAGDLNFLREAGHKIDNVKWRNMQKPWDTVTITGSASSRRIVDDADAVDDMYAFGTGPTDAHTSFLHVGAMSVDGGSISAVRFDIKINLTVVLTEPVAIGES